MTEHPDPVDLTVAANTGQMESLGSAIERHYAELRNIADGLLRREGPGVTLQPTALVHEVVIRLLDGKRLTHKGSATFRGFFAHVCRHVLVDRARARKAQKRGDGQAALRLSTLGPELGVVQDCDVLQVDELLQQLATIDARMARIVELRVFADLTVPECAEALGVSERTINTDWRLASDWLKRQLSTA